jgi:hypothetical protein
MAYTNLFVERLLSATVQNYVAYGYTQPENQMQADIFPDGNHPKSNIPLFSLS